MDQMRVFQLLLHLSFSCRSKAQEEEEDIFWVSRGQDVCLIILELEEIILMLKRDYRVLPARSMQRLQAEVLKWRQQQTDKDIGGCGDV